MISIISKRYKSLINTKLFYVVMGIILIFLSAQVQIPLNPVPITLYTVAILIIALCYPKKEAIQSIVGFITIGAFGAPVFAGFTGGMSILLGPTGGYIFGFVLCIYLVTAMREKFGDDSWLKLLIYSAVGTISIFVLGLAQLTLFVGIEKSIEVGLMPFIFTGIVKTFFTASSVRLIKKISWTKKSN